MLIARSARRRIAAGTIILLVLGIAVGACAERKYGPAETLVRRGIGGDISTLDPQKAGDYFSEEVLRDLFEGLTSENPDGGVIPALAESWDVTDDGRTYRFALRHAARWSNGEPVTADDVVLGIRRALDPNVASPAASLLRAIEHAPDVLRGSMKPESLGVSAADSHSVIIHLTHATPYLPLLLARCVAFPVHAPSVRRLGDRFAAAANLVSNGPYRVESLEPNTKISLIRNPYYWDTARVAVERIEHHVLTDASAELLRYRASELDITSTLPAARFEWARQQFGTELQVRSQMAVVYVAFNLKAGPLKNSAKLREALSLTIDRDALAHDVLRAGQVPAYSFVPPSIPGYSSSTYDWQSETPAARLARARRLYRESGYSDGNTLSLRMLHNENEAFRSTALTTAAGWKAALGIDVEFHQREFKTFLAERAERGTWDVLVSGWGADIQDPSNFLEVFLSSGAANDAGLADADFDAIMARADSEPNAATRFSLLADAERRLLYDYAIAPIYFPVLRRLVKPSIEGAALNPLGHNYSKALRVSRAPVPPK